MAQQQSGAQPTSQTSSPTEANPFRGEMQIEMGGQSFLGRLSIGDLVVLERKMKRTVIEILASFATGEVTIPDVITILSDAIKGGGANGVDVQKLIQDEGLKKSIIITVNMLKTSINPNWEEEEAEERKRLEGNAGAVESV